MISNCVPSSHERAACRHCYCFWFIMLLNERFFKTHKQNIYYSVSKHSAYFEETSAIGLLLFLPILHASWERLSISHCTYLHLYPNFQITRIVLVSLKTGRISWGRGLPAPACFRRLVLKKCKCKYQHGKWATEKTIIDCLIMEHTAWITKRCWY